jgi:hypothetical protein
LDSLMLELNIVKLSYNDIPFVIYSES